MSPCVFTFRLHPELKKRLRELAERQSLSLNELMARVLSLHINAPELGIIPRKPYGRRPKMESSGKASPS